MCAKTPISLIVFIYTVKLLNIKSSVISQRHYSNSMFLFMQIYVNK